MANSDIMSTISWTLLGVVLDGLFLGHGVLLFHGSAPGSSLGMVGVLTTVYAVGTSAALLAAWLIPVRAVLVAGALLTAAYIAAIVVTALQLDVVRSFEWIAGIVLIVAFIVANLFAIQRVQARTITAER